MTLNERIQEIHDYNFEGRRIPRHMVEILAAYIEERRPMGDFLYLLLMNDIIAALHHADSENMWAVPVYVGYLYNHAPSACWGTKETYENWIKGGRII